MSIFDYMNVVSGYIINKMENKKDLDSNIEFKINSVSENNSLFYVVEEIVNSQDNYFYLKFPCASKKDFYEALNALLVEYFKNSGLLAYTAIKSDSALSIVSKNRMSVSVGMQDEIDAAMFMEFKKYLDSDKKEIISETNLTEENEDEIYEDEIIPDSVHTLGKIML